MRIELELANDRDLVLARYGKPSPGNMRRAKIRGIVRRGTMRLTIPGCIVDQLGLESCGSTQVHYADGRIADRSLARVHLSLMGRAGIYTAIVEPEAKSVVIGWIVLEDLDLVAVGQSLVPRDADRITCEV